MPKNPQSTTNSHHGDYSIKAIRSLHNKSKHYYSIKTFPAKIFPSSCIHTRTRGLQCDTLLLLQSKTHYSTLWHICRKNNGANCVHTACVHIWWTDTKSNNVYSTWIVMHDISLGWSGNEQLWCVTFSSSLRWKMNWSDACGRRSFKAQLKFYLDYPNGMCRWWAMLIFEEHKFDSQIKIWHHLSFWFHWCLYGTHNVCVCVSVEILSKCNGGAWVGKASECEWCWICYFQYVSHAKFMKILFFNIKVMRHTQNAERETIK